MSKPLRFMVQKSSSIFQRFACLGDVERVRDRPTSRVSAAAVHRPRAVAPPETHVAGTVARGLLTEVD